MPDPNRFDGDVKVIQPKEKLAASGMGWTEDFTPGMIKTIGLLEVLAAIELPPPFWAFCRRWFRRPQSASLPSWLARRSRMAAARKRR